MTTKDGYVFTLGFGFHKIYTYGKTYEEAKAVCQNDGAHLAVVNSPAEAQVRNNFLLNDLLTSQNRFRVLCG